MPEREHNELTTTKTPGTSGVVSVGTTSGTVSGGNLGTPELTQGFSGTAVIVNTNNEETTRYDVAITERQIEEAVQGEHDITADDIGSGETPIGRALLSDGVGGVKWEGVVQDLGNIDKATTTIKDLLNRVEDGRWFLFNGDHAIIRKRTHLYELTVDNGETIIQYSAAPSATLLSELTYTEQNYKEYVFTNSGSLTNYYTKSEINALFTATGITIDEE